MLGQREARLVVIEFGASWPAWLSVGEHGHTAVVAQHYEGQPMDLVTQVASRVSKLEQQGWRATRLVLALNARIDPEAVTSRQVLGRGLVARLEQGGGGELHVTTNVQAGRRARYLAETLASSLGRVSDRVRVSLQVGDAESATAARAVGAER